MKVRTEVALTSFRIAASIAMSWLWGLGFFFSIHFAQAYGWVGLLAFAIPNALGLFLFGCGTNALQRQRPLRAFVEAEIKRVPAVFLSFQLVAISLTVFAVTKYFFQEVGLDVTLIWTVAILAAALLSAEILGFAGVVWMHGVYFAVFMAVGGGLLCLAPMPELRPDRGGVDLTFVGYVVPLVAGLLLGPWLDLQQWQRAIAIAESGGNVRRGYELGAALFFGLLLMVGGLSLAIVPGGNVPPLSVLDGYVHAEGLLAATLHSARSTEGMLLFALMAGLAVVSTLDSAQLALRWFLAVANRGSDNILLGMLPDALTRSTLPCFALATLIAAGALAVGADLEQFMIFYATYFVTNALVLVIAIYSPQAPKLSGSMVFLTAAVSMATMAIGYFERQPLAMIAAVAVQFVLLLPPPGRQDPSAKPARHASAAEFGLVQAPFPSTPSPVPCAMVEMPADAASHSRHPVDRPAPPKFSPPDADTEDGWFDDKWFTIPIVPTYNDTNSVGNVYFANYVAWVGKARELMFHFCMPDFTVEDTDFYILTRNFNHKYVCEIREFQPVRVRLRIGGYNRKFVKLEHEIRGADGRLIGAGDQSVMFVDSRTYGLIDIPGKVYHAFIKYAPAKRVELPQV